MIFQPKWFLTCLFLVIIFGVPLSQLAFELGRGDKPVVLEVFNKPIRAKNLRAYERGLESASVVADRMRPWVQMVQFQWLRDGGDKAVRGRDGWLFYRPGLDSTIRRPSTINRKLADTDPLPAIVAFRDALAARGIQLVVVTAPNKESVYPDKLTYRAAHLRSLPSPAAVDLIQRLQDAQVEVIDLFQVFVQVRQDASSAEDKYLYLSQDSHWSPEGIHWAAQAVAKRLLELGWAETGTAEYQQRPVTVQRVGDIIQMLKVPSIEHSVLPETVLCQQVFSTADEHAYQDDPAAEILVIGDSFLRIFQSDEPSSAGFISHLAKELRQPVTSLVNDGGASTLVRQELFRRAKLLQNKQVVVWEFVERDITLGTEGWQIVPLPPE